MIDESHMKWVRVRFSSARRALQRWVPTVSVVMVDAHVQLAVFLFWFWSSRTLFFVTNHNDDAILAL